jgi:hypothetical protein
MATPKPRTTPGINQPTVNKNYKNNSNTSSYLGNVGKEFSDLVKTYSALTEMSNKSGPGTDAEANRLRSQQDKDLGQLAGAILKGRRYDTKGNQIK